MEKLKILFQQTLMISIGILFFTGINGLISHLAGTDFYYAWYYPLTIIFIGFLCALPTFLFIMSEWSGQRRFLSNLILHCLSVWVIVSIAGRILKWYFILKQFLMVTMEYILIYIFVWLASMWLIRAEDKIINQALTDIQDKE